MDRIDTPQENTPRTLAIALSLWTLVAGTLAAEGAFARFPAAEFAALSAFATAFAIATGRLDERVRALVASLGTRRLVALGALADLLLALAFVLAWGRTGEAPASLPAWPLALAPLVALPVAAVLHLAALERLAAARPRPALSSPEGKAPVTRPAAT